MRRKGTKRLRWGVAGAQSTAHLPGALLTGGGPPPVPASSTRTRRYTSGELLPGNKTLETGGGPPPGRPRRPPPAPAPQRR